MFIYYKLEPMKTTLRQCRTVVPIVTGGAGRGAGGVEPVEVEAPPTGQALGGATP